MLGRHRLLLEIHTQPSFCWADHCIGARPKLSQQCLKHRTGLSATLALLLATCSCLTPLQWHPARCSLAAARLLFINSYAPSVPPHLLYSRHAQQYAAMTGQHTNAPYLEELTARGAAQHLVMLLENLAQASCIHGGKLTAAACLLCKVLCLYKQQVKVSRSRVSACIRLRFLALLSANGCRRVRLMMVMSHEVDRWVRQGHICVLFDVPTHMPCPAHMYLFNHPTHQ